MAVKHKVEIEIETNGEITLIKGEMSFSNGIAQSFQYTELPPCSTIDCMSELTHALKVIDGFNKRMNGSIKRFEITKI